MFKINLNSILPVIRLLLIISLISVACSETATTIPTVIAEMTQQADIVEEPLQVSTPPNNNSINPSININPTSGPIGTEHILELIHFTPNGLADINVYYLGDGNLVLNFQVEVDNSGYKLTTISSEKGDNSGEYRVVAYDQATGLFTESTFYIEQAVEASSPQFLIVPASLDFTPGEDTGGRELFNFVYIGNDDWGSLIIQNTGSISLVIASFEFTSPNPEDFHIGDQGLDPGSTNIIGAKIDPQQSCYIIVVFQPLGTGERQANLIIRSDETEVGTVKAEVIVHGLAMFNTTGLASTASPLNSFSIPGCHQLVN